MNKSSEIRNILITVVLSFAILQGWYYFFPPAEQAEADAEQQQSTAADVPTGVAATNATEAEAAAPVSVPISIATPTLQGTLDTLGSRFTALTLTQHDETLHSEENITLLSQELGKRYDITFGWLQRQGAGITGNTAWQLQSAATLSPENPVILHANLDGVTVTRTISIDEHYMVTLTDALQNEGTAPKQLYPYAAIYRDVPEIKEMFISHEGPIQVLDSDLEEHDYDDIIGEKSRSVKQAEGWFGIADKYWLTAIIPSGKADVTLKQSTQSEQGTAAVQYNYRGEAIDLQPGATANYTQRAFMGAKHLNVIDNYAKQYDIPLFDRAIDFGWLYFITKPTSQLLNWIYAKVGNFGVSIIILTIIVRLLLFPLANKSFKSMARMKQVMPELQALRERHKDDRLRLNQEMMKLYKEKRINPMSGCMPLLLQIPILFALYKVLYVSLEMRHAPFIAWMKDLSAPDPTNLLNLFGLLPFDLPGWLPVIGILPILFAASMWLQQSLNPKPTDATQAMVMKWLPLVLLFVFAGFPAGLVLYWTWSNLLSILQQWVITKKINRAAE